MNSKNKNTNKKILGAILVALFAPSAFALQICNFCLDCPYVGFELIQTNQNYKEGYGKGLFYKDQVNYNVFGGLRFARWLGLEAGYEASSKKGSQVRLEAGDRFPGNVLLDPGEFAIMESTIQVTHPYAGIFATCGWRCISMQAMIGASVSHLKARYASLATETGNLTTDQYNSTVRTFSKTKVLPMAKISGLYKFNNNFALRANFNYRNTSLMKTKAQQGSGVAEIKMKDTIGVGLGVLFTFN